MSAASLSPSADDADPLGDASATIERARGEPPRSLAPDRDHATPLAELHARVLDERDLGRAPLARPLAVSPGSCAATFAVAGLPRSSACAPALS